MVGLFRDLGLIHSVGIATDYIRKCDFFFFSSLGLTGVWQHIFSNDFYVWKGILDNIVLAMNMQHCQMLDIAVIRKLDIASQSLSEVER